MCRLRTCGVCGILHIGGVLTSITSGTCASLLSVSLVTVVSVRVLLVRVSVTCPRRVGAGGSRSALGTAKCDGSMAWKSSLVRGREVGVTTCLLPSVIPDPPCTVDTVSVTLLLVMLSQVFEGRLLERMSLLVGDGTSRLVGDGTSLVFVTSQLLEVAVMEVEESLAVGWALLYPV